MAFAAELFPVEISLGAHGGPQWVTSIVRVNSGREYRNRVQTVPLARWDVSHAARRPSFWERVRNFHYVMHGRETAFLFKDWTDYTVSITEGVFSMITSTTFQMEKRYAFGSQQYDRPIYKPISGTVSSITGGTLSSVDYATGIVTMSAGTPTAWAGQFNIPARFDIDNLPTNVIDRMGGTQGFILGVSQIPIVETRDIA